MDTEKVPSATPILLAESDPEILVAVNNHLDEFQLRNVTVAKSASVVLRPKNAKRYDLILLGTSLSELSPLKVVAALRASAENAETPIVFFYGSEEKELAEKATGAGASVALEKPVKPESLRATIEEFLGKRIVTKTEEEVLLSKHVGPISRAVEEVENIRAEGDFEAGEAAFMDALFVFFSSLMGLFTSKGEGERAERVREEVEKAFPDFKDRMEHPPRPSGDGDSQTPRGALPSSQGKEKAEHDMPILLAENDAETLSAFESIFPEMQLRNITVVNEGFDVLSLDDSTRFALIFLGGSLKDMSPGQVIAGLRTGVENSETPLIFLHAPGDAPLAEEALSAGASAAVEKPVEIHVLREKMEELLGVLVPLQTEEKERSAQYIEAAAKTADVLNTLKQEGYFEGAEEVFLEVLRDLFLTTVEMYLSRGEKGRANNLLDEARKTFPDIMGQFREKAKSFLVQGHKFLKDGNLRRAKAEYEALLTLNGQNMEACVGLGECYLGLENPDEALRAFGHAIQSSESPQGPSLLNHLGLVACRHELYDVALDAYDRLLSVFQLDAKLYYNKSLVHVRKREFGKALPLLSRALTLDEEFAPAKALHKKVRGWMSQMPEVAKSPE